MLANFSLPTLLEDEIDALIEAGYYPNKSDVLKDAIRTLMETRSDLKLAASIEMFRKGKVSVGRASELAGLSVVEFKEVLIARGIDRQLLVEGEDMKKSDDLIKKMK